jgi:hypothetical protein
MHNILVFKIEGVYKWGSEGNHDAWFISSKIDRKRIITLSNDNKTNKVLIDLSDFSYKWGDGIFVISGLQICEWQNIRIAFLLGKDCMESLGKIIRISHEESKLLFDKDREQNNIFISIDKAIEYLVNE